MRTDSTAWATQMKLLAPTVVRRLNEELGDGTVPVIEVLGPHGASLEARSPVGPRRPRTRATPTAEPAVAPGRSEPICGRRGGMGTRNGPCAALQTALRGRESAFLGRGHPRPVDGDARNRALSGYTGAGRIPVRGRPSLCVQT